MRKSLLAAAAVLGLAGAGVLDTAALAQTAATDAQATRPARRHAAPRHSTATDAAAGVTDDGTAPPTSAYRGGASVPLSERASNIGPGTTRSEIAPRLPNPDAASNSPEALLRAAQRSLSQNRTGAAQQALEMAETRILSRTVEPANANTPDPAAMVQHIGEARRALGAGDRAGAQAAIAAALQAPVPPPGPAVTIVPGVAPAPMGMAPRTY